MRTLFDVNVLIALFDPAHIHHERAHAWWERNRAGGWASCPITQNGFVRVLPQPGCPNAVTASEAMRLLRSAVASQDHAFRADDISLLDQQAFDDSRILGPKQLTDIYLLALSLRNAGRFATFAKAVRRSAVRGAAIERIVVI